MATYIGLNYNTLFEEQNVSPLDFSSITSPNSISYSLILTSSTPWTIGGNRYMVYQIAALSDGSTIDSTWFIHSYGGNIGSIDDLPLNSKIVYATSDTGTFSGNGFSSGTLYYSSNSFTNPKQPNTWSSATNPGGVAGTSYTYYNRQTSTVSSGKCTNSNFCPTSSYGVSIVELYHSTNGVSNATGLYTSIIDRGAAQSDWSAGTYKSWIYDYKRTANTGSSYPARINGTERKVFAIHNTTNSDCNLAIAYGGSTSTTLSDTNYTIGAFGYTKVAYNTWAHHTTEGKHYYSITANANSKFASTSLRLEAGSAYTIKMHTYSEANYDGIVISEKKLTSASLSSSSTDVITKCSGVDKKVTYTLASSTSTRTLYIYFKTDSSTLTGPGNVDSTGASINNSTIPNYSTGDVEIYKDNVYVVTFNANGGNFGGTVSTKTTNVIVGQSLNLNTITKPTRTGWDFYKWSVGDTHFNFASSSYIPKGNVTLYAIWGNFPKFTELSDKSVYCTDDCIAASSTQGSKSIKLFSGTGMTCKSGTVTYMSNRSKVYPVGSPSSPISGATIQPVGTDNNVTVPTGTPAGDYIASITVYTSASPTSPGSYYGPTADTTVTYNIPFTIKATTLTYGPVQYMTYTPDGELTNGNITQQKKFPASQFTISPSTIGDYFKTYGVFKQAVSCNNGTQREGNVTVNGWGPTPGFSNIVVPSLGTTISDEYTYTFASSNGNALVFDAAGEGGRIFRKFILSGVREANALTNTNYAPYSYIARVAIGNGLAAGGGEAAVTASASHMAYDYYTSGSYNNPHGVTDGVSWSITTQTFTPSGGSASTITRFSKSGNTLSHTTMGTSAGTDYVKVTAVNGSSSSATASAEKSITNEVVNSDYNASNSNYNVSVNIGSGLNAGKSDAAVSVSGSHTHTYYYYYTSGSTSGPYTATHSDSPTWSITSQYINSSGNPIERFSKSGNTLSHATMGSTTGTDYVTITATNNSATKEAKTNVTNTKDSTNYAPYNYTVSVSIGNGLIAGGGEAVISASASHMAYDYYTSGSYNNSHSVSDGVSWSITTQTFTPSGGSASAITRFSQSGNTLSHTTMGTSAGTDYVKVTATNSSNTSTTSTAEKSITNTKDSTNYAPYNYTASVSIGSGLTAAGGSATVTASASHMAYDYYTSGSYNNPHSISDTAKWMITSNGNSRFSHPSSGGTSLSGVGTVYGSGASVSHSSMGTTATTDTVTVTAYNTTSISATASAEKSITNTKDSTNYAPYNYTASVSIGNGLWAGGGEAAISASASHMAYDYYTSGSYNNSHSVTDGVSWSITTQTFTPSGGSASTITRFSKSGNTLSHTTMTSNIGTDYVKVTAVNGSSSSTTASAEKSITNELGTQKYKNTSGTTGYNIVYTVPTVSIGSELSAAGGTATVNCSVTNNTNWYQKYTSGTYTSQKTSTETGTARWMITSNGNSRFSHPSSGGVSLSGVGTVYNTGTKVSHSNMTTNATTDTVTVTAYNIGDTSKTKTASVSVSNTLTGISISLGSNSIKYNSTTTATVTATYTSGSSKDVTSSLSTSSSATSNYIKSGDTSVVTIS